MHKLIKNSDHIKVLQQLQNLTPEDRILLGLYLYEGLSTNEINEILSYHSSPKVKARKETKKSQRKRPTVH